MPDRPPLRIFVIEDSEAHAKILKWAFDGLQRQARVSFFPDGESALARLGKGEIVQKNVPDLIILDLNLPGIDGRDVLRKLKSDPNISDVPVLVLSSSDNEKDIRMAYELGASTFICKSDILGELKMSMQSIIDYWSNLARLPKRNEQ